MRAFGQSSGVGWGASPATVEVERDTAKKGCSGKWAQDRSRSKRESCQTKQARLQRPSQEIWMHASVVPAKIATHNQAAALEALARLGAEVEGKRLRRARH